jgi:hypothetical protein
LTNILYRFRYRRQKQEDLATNMKHILVLLTAGIAANAQFKEIKEAPFPPAEAPRKIATLLEKTDPDNRNQTVSTLLGWSDWYRDILDRELIARWQGDNRANLTLVMRDLANSYVASQVVEYSWRRHRTATFTLAYAPTLGDLMARYPESARPFLDDLLSGQPGPALSPSEAEAVCRILLDMPDTGTWRADALRILPRYRQPAERLLTQDINGPDQEKIYRAHTWLHDLKWDDAGGASSGQVSQSRQVSQRTPQPAAPPPPPAYIPDSQRPHVVSSPSPAPVSYDGARSGTLESSGSPIPQNGEYVFRNLPPVKMQLEYDTKHWEARLEQGGEGQRLVVRNKGNGPQKRCVVHWTAIQ